MVEFLILILILIVIYPCRRAGRLRSNSLSGRLLSAKVCGVKEELDANPDVVYKQQMAKVQNYRGRMENTPRRRVRRGRVVCWYLLALAALALWALRLYGVIEAPF